MSWKDEPLSFMEILEFQRMKNQGWKGAIPRNRGEFRKIWEEYTCPRKVRVIDLYHITSINNLDSIMKCGLLAGSEMEKMKINPDNISNKEIVKMRNPKPVGNSNYTIHDCALLYFQPRNSMLYKITRDSSIREKTIILRFAYDANEGGYFTKMNAVYQQEFYKLDSENDKMHLEYCLRLINEKSWEGNHDKEKSMMAEALIPKKIGTNHLKEIKFYDEELHERLRNIVKKLDVEVKRDPEMFFL